MTLNYNPENATALKRNARSSKVLLGKHPKPYNSASKSFESDNMKFNEENGISMG